MRDFGLYLVLLAGLLSHRALANGLPDLRQVVFKPFYVGMLGQYGTQSFFYASKKVVPDAVKTYWAMVHVLSSRYGCFLRKRIRSKRYTSFLCRDGRIVVFELLPMRKYVFFTGRQFDQFGQELLVRKGQVLARYPVSGKEN